MSLTMRRNRHLIAIGILFLLILIYFGEKRVISINIGNKGEVTTDYFNIENTIDLFDTTQVHEIKVLMTEEEYKDMIDTYANTSEKDRYKTDVIIDGVTIYDVGIRLKGNSSLKGIGGNDGFGHSESGMDRGKGKNRVGSGNNRMGGYHGNMMRGGMGGFPDVQNLSGENNEQFPGAFEGGSFGPGTMSGDSITYDTQLPLFIKFDKYVDQTYQGHEMISLRVGGMGSDSSLLAEPYSYSLFQEAGQPAPDTAYGVVSIEGITDRLFIVSELPEDEYYIQKRFGDDNGILYKAGNFIDFTYLGEDPTLYSDSFTQKTRVNDYDFSPLIRMLKFVSESDDEEFESEIDSYIDVESVLILLAIDDFVGNNDSFGGMGSNYYLYYHLGEQRFYLLTWDQNLAFNGMGGGGKGGMGGFPGGNMFSGAQMSSGTEGIGNMQDSSAEPQNDNSENLDFTNFKGGEIGFPGEFTGGFPEGMEFPGRGNNGKGGFGRNGNNELKTRLLANERFKAMYDEIYAKIEEIALNSDFSENFFTEWTTAFLKYNKGKNIVSEESYLQGVEKLKSYLEQKKGS